MLHLSHFFTATDIVAGDSLTYRTKATKMPKFSQDCSKGATCIAKRCGYVHPAQRAFFGSEVYKLPKWQPGAQGAE
jgi:hypothetical protein